MVPLSKEIERRVVSSDDVIPYIMESESESKSEIELNNVRLLDQQIAKLKHNQKGSIQER